MPGSRWGLGDSLPISALVQPHSREAAQPQEHYRATARVNLAAQNVRLTTDELRQIDAILPAAAGDRYPPHAMRVIDK